MTELMWGLGVLLLFAKLWQTLQYGIRRGWI
jgi:hypothetical protein